ncbi:hypothetical protein TIFTF001_003670 [Ficus carica]|uniref:Expansin n=1 Tax=Ficus carica TaxID=3494 RepID=A0AA88DB12_FICCA|nr:hypothetical protein TIFTF001_003670 [Ficus carica]
MASFVHSRCFISFFLLACMFAGTTAGTVALPRAIYYRPSPWKLAHATFYGDETAQETMAQHYSTTDMVVGNAFKYNVFSPKIATQGSPPSPLPTSAPPNWSQDSNAGGWCNPPRVHFDMSKPAFMKIAWWRAGIVPIQYRRVPCNRKGGLRFSFQGNGYWLLVYVMNVGGGGDIASMSVKGSRTGWISMSHNWGASYQAFATLGGQALSFRVTSYTTKQTVVTPNVAPPNWRVGLTYASNVNFR